MLDDKDQFRRRLLLEFSWPVTLLLIVLNVLVFVLQNLAENLDGFPLYHDFALSVDGLKHGRFWQLITFQFLHVPLFMGGIFHLLGNLFALHLLGPAVERKIGRLNFIKLYLLSGTLGGLLQMTGGFFAPEYFGGVVVGASAGTFGVLAAFATYFPSRNLHAFFLPVAVRADVLLALAVVVTVAGLFLPSGHVAHCAHLGGIFCGFLLRTAWRAPTVRPWKLARTR